MKKKTFTFRARPEGYRKETSRLRKALEAAELGQAKRVLGGVLCLAEKKKRFHDPARGAGEAFLGLFDVCHAGEPAVALLLLIVSDSKGHHLYSAGVLYNEAVGWGARYFRARGYHGRKPTRPRAIPCNDRVVSLPDGQALDAVHRVADFFADL